MSKWIEVDSIYMSGKVLINTKSIGWVGIDKHNVTIIIFVSGREDDYMEVHNSYDEIKEMILH